MTDVSSSFELLEFEQVQAGSRTVLLRLALRPFAGFRLEGLSLVLDAGSAPVHLTPLPGPPGAADLVRAAFATAPEVLSVATTYALELADGELVPLPEPVPRSAGRRPTPAAPPPEHPDSPRIAEAEQRAASRRLAIVELQRRLSAEHSRRSAAEAEARTARAAATAEASAHVELRTRLADIEAESERVRAALDDATRSAAAEAQAAAELAAQVAELEAAAAHADARHAQIQAELAQAAADLEAARGELEHRDARLQAAGDELEGTRASHQDELDAAANAAEVLRTQLMELELRLEDEQARLQAAESDVHVGREQFAGIEAELAGVRAAAEEVASALADRTTEIELQRDAAAARERELEDQIATLRRASESELADRAAIADAAPEPVASAPDGLALALAADALLAGAAEVELLRLSRAARSEPAAAEAGPDRSAEVAELLQRLDESEAAVAEAQGQLDAARHEAAEGQHQLVDVREQLASAETAKTDLQQRLDQAIAARNLPPEAEAYERELVELRGAIERAQNRARLHRQHSSSLELELAEAKQELIELRHQVQAVTSSGEVAPMEEVEALREQVAYGEALVADLEWQLDEARVNEEAAEAALAIRAAEVELLSVALRELSAATDEGRP